MLRPTLRLSTLAAIVALTIAVAAPAVGAAGQSGSVQVSSQVNACASVSVTSPDHVVVYANAPWLLTCETEHGVVSIAGDSTDGTALALPAGTTSYSVSFN
jgi:hypothetical protein